MINVVIKEIDITKLKPFDWKWLVGFTVAVGIAIILIGISKWGAGKLKGMAPTQKATEATI